MPGRSRFSGIARRYRPGGHFQTRCRRLISRGGVCWCGRIFRRCVRLGDGGGRKTFRCRSCWGERGWLGCRRIWAWDGFWGKFGGGFAAFDLSKTLPSLLLPLPGKSPPPLSLPLAWQKSAIAFTAFGLAKVRRRSVHLRPNGLRCVELWRTFLPPKGRYEWRRGESNPRPKIDLSELLQA